MVLVGFAAVTSLASLILDVLDESIVVNGGQMIRVLPRSLPVHMVRVKNDGSPRKYTDLDEIRVHRLHTNRIYRDLPRAGS